MVFAGIGACLMAKFAVWLLGFCSNGIRRHSFAAFLMKSNSGRIPADSFFAVMQSIGASGLGPLRSVKIFVTGAMLYLSYRMYCKIPIMKPNGTFDLP
jgi:hypothetical protein